MSHEPQWETIGPPPIGPFAREQRRAHLAQPIGVPTTSIYSRSDGIVHWQSCLEQPGPERESVEVDCSHTGMGFHPQVITVVADRLAQPEGAWRPHRAEKLAV